MVEDICFHIVDLVQNAVAAGARNIHVDIRESPGREHVDLEVADDGKGMSREEALRAQDPFYTTKSFKKVGLGIPLLKATAESCQGVFSLESEPGKGTTVRTRMDRRHPDCPPLGDLPGTILDLLISLDEINLVFTFENEKGSFDISRNEIRGQIGDLHLSHPDVQSFLRGYFRENLQPLLQ